MENFERTIISQYGTSPILRQLVQNMDEHIRPDADIENFLSFVWDIDTAQDWGLDILGKIVGIDRYITLPPSMSSSYFGFKGTGNQPWGQAPFYTKAAQDLQFALSDDAYRTAIKGKALANITRLTIPAMNQMLNNLFAGRGRCFVTDLGDMQMTFVFEFDLAPFEIAILAGGKVLPEPTGVQANILKTGTACWGFKQQAEAQTFGHGTFFNRTSGLIPVA